jgi:hypothetical protein
LTLSVTIDRNNAHGASTSGSFCYYKEVKPLRDKNAKDIEPGQTLRRLVDHQAAYKGQRYIVKQYNWHTGGEGEDLIADTGFIKELLNPVLSKDFEIIE